MAHMVDLPATEHEPVLEYPAESAAMDKSQRLKELRSRVALLLEGESDWLANLGNAAAEIYAWMPNLNWAGWYLLRNDELVLGPFQGRPACVRIQVGRGVCGTAVTTGQSQVVEDVNAFPGHIACDVRSKSELVVPVKVNGRVVAVLDLDSSLAANFDEEDRIGFEALVADLQPLIDWERAVAS